MTKVIRGHCGVVVVVIWVAMGILWGGSAQARAGELKQAFYKESCPRAEKIVFNFVEKHISLAPSLAPALLRMHFHDCFVRGCDGSVLINSTSSKQTEKAASPNLTVRGFDFIDRVKSLVEKECPGVVSCADILALVARDAVGVIGGPRWRVPTGRRDGRISKKAEAEANIPGPSLSFGSLISSFASKGLDLNDLVWLSGAHTIGIAHCQFFSTRLYNFTGQGGLDPSLDPFYAAKLKQACSSPADNTTFVEMDPGSFLTFNIGYYKNLLKRRALFSSDAALITNATALSGLHILANGTDKAFFRVFAISMEKLSKIGVKTGSEGEIRKHCAIINT